MSNQIGYRVVSTFVGPEQVLRWTIQQLADDDSECKWRNSVIKGVNFFTTSDRAVERMNQLVCDRVLHGQEIK